MTWWWIPVLETSRSSRLSVVGYTSRPAHTTEDVQKYADILDPGQFLYFWLLQTVLHPTTYCYVVTSWIWMLFCSRHRSSPPDELLVFSCFHASRDDDNRSPFQLSLVHAIFLNKYPALNDNENDNETISISWQNVLRWWMAQMWKDSWDDSLPFNIVTCLLRSFRCYAYSLAAPHCFSPSRFISGMQIVKLHLQVWDWWQLSTGPVSILYFLMISLSLTWPGCTRGPISWTAATEQRAAVWRSFC